MAESIHQTHSAKNNLRVFYSHIQLPDQEVEQPCMCIGRNGLRKVAWVIPLTAAYLYADSKSGGPTPHLINSCFRMCEMFNMHPDKWTLNDLADLVLDNLPELLRMPCPEILSTEAMLKQAVEEQGLSIKVDGQDVIH